MKSLRRRLGQIRRGLYQVVDTTKEKHAEELFGKPPNQLPSDTPSKGTNFEALEKIHRLIGQ